MPRLEPVPSFKPAYLVHGDDHGRIGERRARLRAMAEAESGSAGVEVFEPDACCPGAIAAALSAMTFAIGRRVVIADGVERWKEGDVADVAAAMAGMDPETLTVAFFAREEGRYKAPAALHKAVEAARGQIAVEDIPKARALPKWLAGQAKELGVELDDQAARALVAQVGDRRLRLRGGPQKPAPGDRAGGRDGARGGAGACGGAARAQAGGAPAPAR